MNSLLEQFLSEARDVLQGIGDKLMQLTMGKTLMLFLIGAAPLEEGMNLVPGYRKLDTLVEPFLMALDRGEEAFALMLIESRYFRAVMRRSKLREWSNYVKWSTEAVFERVRTREFPDCPGRLASLF